MEEPIASATNLEKGVNSHRHTAKGKRLSPIVKAINYIVEETTFFRAHLAAFTFIPLIFSGIFFASNGRFHISFLDSMFLCYSAMTVTGLSTVNLSTLTTWQQFILYFLMCIGDITIVSWAMVLIRKRFFKTHCEYVVAKRKKPMSIRSRASFMRSISSPSNPHKQRQPAARQEPSKPDATSTDNEKNTLPHIQFVGPTPNATKLWNIAEQEESVDGETQTQPPRLITGGSILSSSPKSHDFVLSPLSEPALGARSPPIVDFARSTTISPRTAHYHPMMTLRGGRPAVRRGTTMLSSKVPPEVPGITNIQSQKYQGLGGFPGPTQLLSQVIKITAPHAFNKLERTMTIQSMTTLQSSKVPWLNFSGLVVGRNSDFHTESLTDEQLEDIGGAEYRALNLLSWLVPTYFIVCQLISVLLFLPWLAATKSYSEVFQNQPQGVSTTWFSFFQVMGAYTGGGLSLVDAGMVPFQGAYLMIFALIFVILAGNHALPIFLRLVIWTASKILDEHSEAQEALSFLLQHPRRCFLYLFPSHQTWFLVLLLVAFSIVEWVAFFVLNIGLPAFEAIPKGQRVVAGLFQGLAARASGFSIVPLASLAPALLFLYTVMMYIAVYPVAMSIRSTNVYEEQSLGVFEAPLDEDDEPEGLEKLPSASERVGRYVGWHLRRQLSIDIWWLVWAIFLIAIIERKNLMDDTKKWFDLFRVLFELVSAFGGIGLSLGLPTDNFSFVGAMSPLSKLIVIVIMVRGRHRGLPVAVDRAVLLPSELVVNTSEQSQNQSQAKNPVQEQQRPIVQSPASQDAYPYPVSILKSDPQAKDDQQQSQQQQHYTHYQSFQSPVDDSNSLPLMSPRSI
ncbi:hypothetical protein D9613_003643 [Agrocybe pediades]|uniref:Potassium transport protein n=1 Tax=Agrocybe pediades TaxID=84607 RepID=A0A8H4QII2_9AGAR|nr:hypothetical protein D9613_003643 [Agrocybe pediades]